MQNTNEPILSKNYNKNYATKTLNFVASMYFCSATRVGLLNE